MAAFGTKNIHSAMAQKLVPSTNVLKMLFKLQRHDFMAENIFELAFFVAWHKKR